MNVNEVSNWQKNNKTWPKIKEINKAWRKFIKYGNQRVDMLAISKVKHLSKVK